MGRQYIENFARTTFGQVGLRKGYYAEAETKSKVLELFVNDWDIIYRHLWHLDHKVLGKIIGCDVISSMDGTPMWEVMKELLGRQSASFPYGPLRVWPGFAAGGSALLRWMATAIVVGAMTDMIWADVQGTKALKILQTLQPASGTDPEFDYGKGQPKSDGSEKFGGMRPYSRKP